MRTVWEVELADISATHLHPADMEGAIVSIDQPDPPGSWRWGGPDWTGRSGTGAPATLAGATLAVAEPRRVAARWAHVLGVTGPLLPADDPTLALAGGVELRFISIGSSTRGGVVEVEIGGVGGEGRQVTVGGVRLTLR
jgi:hypothetical protein